MTGDTPEAIKQFKLRKSLRLNPLRNPERDTLKRLHKRKIDTEKIPYLPQGYWYHAKFSLGATEEYLLGLYYLQETASQLPVLALQHAAKEASINLEKATVLDMAAAPGSKTTQLAAAMKNKGKIVAVEEDIRRARALGNNLERCGVTNTFVYHKDALHIKDFDMQFDAILLDAPCSGNFSMDKRWFQKRKQHDAKKRAQLQEKLLTQALEVLKPGGIIVYSTCSLEPEENEQVLTNVLNNETLVSTGLTPGEPAMKQFQDMTYRSDMKLARRFWPHKHFVQGFFIAAIQKPK